MPLLLVACGEVNANKLPDAPMLEDAAPDVPGDVALTVTIAGNGAGTVTSSPGGIACGEACAAAYPRDTVVTLTAVPAEGSWFAGWSGACTGTSQICEVTLADVAQATATFTQLTYPVRVMKAGAGTGTITGGGIACGATCVVDVAYGTAVALTATPGPQSTFAGWGGACAGAATCAFTVTSPIDITANFALDDVTLFVSRGGTGVGTVTSTPAGITCGADCQQTYVAGQSVTLSATPATGSTFTGWSGACSGTGACVVTMTAATTVTATFTLNTYALSVNRTGGGLGTVTGTGIACGADCSEVVGHGSTVTLAAAPSTANATRSRFLGWSGACSGTGACSFVVTGDTTVTARFELAPNVMFVTSGMYNGDLGRLDGADTICKNHATAAGLPGTYRAYLSSIDGNNAIHAPSRMGSASAWVRVDGAPVMSSITQFAAGTIQNPPRLTETGADVGNTQIPYAWTGTNANAMYDSTCSAALLFVPWGGVTGSAMVGFATSTTSEVVAIGSADCGTAMRLYCLGVDRAATLP